jgi:uncharacterized protein YicC (UPF0701 family)
MPEVLAGMRQRIRDRLDELQVELDPARLEQEMALLAQRLDVDEEMDRLQVHVAEVRKALDRHMARRPAPRFSDAGTQPRGQHAQLEVLRCRTTLAAVEMKVLIEQMREQVQNLE